MKVTQLPATDSIEELAKFWDSHDLTAFENQLEEVTEPVFQRQPEQLMTLRLEPGEVRAVERIAKSRGVQDSELVREWVLEKLSSLRA
jgi:hypothetical protein